MGEPRTDPALSIPPDGGTGDDADNDYQVIRLSISWGATSIIAFAGILIIQRFPSALGISLPQMIGGTALLAITGLALGLIGLKFGRSRGAARIGTFLNGTVLGLFVLVPIVSGILRRLG